LSKSSIIATISIASLSYLGALLYLFFAQERIIFRRDLAPADIELPPKAQRLFVDGIEVGFIDHKSDTTLFYFGGNAENALDSLHLFAHLPLNIVAMNYPGYGHSKGKPSEEAIYAAALRVYDRFATAKNIIIGRSLGTAVAGYVAAERPAHKVALITPFHSLTDLAKRRYPIFPVRLILRHHFPLYRHIAQTDAPVLVILAEHDTITPPATYKKLRPYIKNLHKEVVIPGSDHIDILEHPATLRAIEEFLGL